MFVFSEQPAAADVEETNIDSESESETGTDTESDSEMSGEEPLHEVRVLLLLSTVHVQYSVSVLCPGQCCGSCCS